MDEHDVTWGRCNHSGLLWALEGLAFSPLYVANVCTCLFQLTAHDPGGRWTNRPANSLAQILSFWIPHTTISLTDRIKVLDLLLKQDQETAWSFLLKLLPSHRNSFSIPNHKPYWRGWANEWLPRANDSDASEFILATARRLVSLAGLNARRWQLLFENLSHLPTAIHGELITGANYFAAAEISDQDRRFVSEELSVQIHRHQHFQDADWSLSPSMISDLIAILDNLRPRSSVLRNVWLFAPYPDRFFEGSGDYYANQRALEEARRIAFEEIIAELGFEGVEVLLEQAESAAQVGRVLAVTMEDEYLNTVIPEYLNNDEKHRAFSAGFVLARFYPDHWDWVTTAIKLCPEPNSQAWFLSFLPFDSMTWNIAKSQNSECEQLYWLRTSAYNPELREEDITIAVEMLVRHGRPGHAIDLVAMAIHGKRQLSEETLFLPLEGLVNIPVESQQQHSRQAVTHDINEIIYCLQELPGANVERLLPIEWEFILVLDHHFGYSPKTLHNQLANSPQWFVDALSLVYVSKLPESERHDAESTFASEEKARRAYRLLSTWTQLPGSNGTGSVDDSKFRSWCIETRNLAKSRDLLEVCDNTIGELIAHAPAAEDGIWPCVAVRNFLEGMNVARINAGVCRGIFNTRGVVFRGSGGDQERELAQKYRSNADNLRIEYPITASILDKVANSYLSEARTWDEDEKWEIP